MYKQRPCFIKSVEATVDYVDIDDSLLNGEKVISSRLIRKICEAPLTDAGYVLKEINLKKASLRFDYALAYNSMGYKMRFLRKKQLLWLLEVEEKGLPYTAVYVPFGEPRLWIFPKVTIELQAKFWFSRLLRETHSHLTADIRTVFTNYLVACWEKLWLVCGYVEYQEAGESALTDSRGHSVAMQPKQFRWYLF